MEYYLNYLRFSDDICATVPVEEGAVFFAKRIGDAAGPRHRPAAEKKGQAEPVILGTVAFNQIDAVPAAKQPDAKRNERIDAMLERHRNDRRAELSRLGHHFTAGIADEPGAVTTRIEPIDFETGAIFLSAPTAAALEMK